MAKLFAALENEETLLDEDISDITPTESEIISDDVSEIVNDISSEAEAALEQLDSTFAYCDRLTAVADRMKKNKSVSTEDIQEIRGYAEGLAARYDVSLECIYPSLALEQKYELALEAIEVKQKSILTASLNVLKNLGTAIGEAMTYSFRVIAYNDAKQKKLTSEISQLGNVKANLYFKNPSSNFCYGDEGLVENFAEYAKEYKRMSEVTAKFNEISADFIKKDFLSSFKTLFSIITMNGDKKIEELYKTLDNFYDELTKVDKFHKDTYYSATENVNAVSNTPMLGNRRIFMTRAENKTSNFTVLQVGVSFISKLSANTRSKGETLAFENVSSEDISSLLKLSQDMSESIYKHKNVRGILSHLGNIQYPMAFANPLPTVILTVFTRSYKAYLATQTSLLNSVGNGVAYAIKQQKQATALAERFKQSVKG